VSTTTSRLVDSSGSIIRKRRQRPDARLMCRLGRGLCCVMLLRVWGNLGQFGAIGHVEHAWGMFS
jgi:hypothetical protein